MINRGKRNLTDRTSEFGAVEGDTGIIRCDACPVLCRIKPGKAGACDRYANEDARLVRCDPLLVAQRSLDRQGQLVSFAEQDESWDGSLLRPENTFVTGIGSGTTYPDYKPAPFIVSSEHKGVDTVTVVTEGIFSYCGLKVKIDTDRHLGPETATVRCEGEQVGHVTTAEYGSQMLSLGGVNNLTGGTRRQGRITCETLMTLANKQSVDLTIDDGSEICLQAGQAPIVNQVKEQRMRVGCGSATIGMFAQQWVGHVDEVVVVDDHITGLLSEHQAGKCLNIPSSGIKIKGRKSTPGRYFQVANPGLGWGGTDIEHPLSLLKKIDPDIAWPGLRLLFTSTTGDESIYYVFDDDLNPVEEPLPAPVRDVVKRIGENCEASLTTVLFMAGAGGSLRSGVTRNPINLTNSVSAKLSRVTMGGAPVYVYPGGGITLMVDVLCLPDNAFGYVPTPALVAPIEFTMSAALYRDCGGHTDHVVSVEHVIEQLGDSARIESWCPSNSWPFDHPGFG